MHLIGRLASTFLAAALCFGFALPANAASGLQYDEVTKFILDGSTPDVGTFQADYTKLASRPAGQGAPPSSLGGIAGMMMKGGNPMAMFSDGFLSRHATLGSWTRTDDPVTQTATITKCDSNQITMLNLANKTYRIIDPTAPAATTARNGSSAPSREEMDPGSTKISMKTTALGPKTIDATPTDGYQTSTLITSERDGKTNTMQVDGTTYFAGMAEPRGCAGRSAMNIGGPMAAMARSASMIRNMMNNDRFKIDVSGPTPPYNRLPLYMVQKMSGAAGGSGAPSGRGGAPTFLIERGNLKTLSDADKSLFEIPAGFTKEN